MRLMRESWTDDRMDDLNSRVDELGRRMEKGFDRVDERLEGMQRTMVQAAIAMTGALFAGFAALIGLITTQL
jgi:hypothetical protein